MAKRPFFWKTYLAAAALLGLGAYIYFVESKREEKPEKAKEKVLALDKAKVKELTLVRKGAETLRLVKEGAVWKMTEPLAVAADSSEVDSLLSTLQNLEVDDVAGDNPARLGDFGLATPKVEVATLLQGATEPLKLLLGDKTPDGSAVYAKLPARPRVFTVASYVTASFDKKPFDLRDRDVLHVKRDAVKTLEVTGPDGSYALARDDKGEWAFTKPLATRAGRWSVDALLGTLEGLRMESVAAEEAKDLKPFGLDRPARRVVLGLADGGNRTLEIGSSPKEKKYSAREAGSRLVAVIPGAIVDDLAKGMKDLRAKRLLEVATYEVEGFDVELGGAGKRVLARSTTKDPKEGFDVYKWKRTAPDAKDLDTNKVQDALFKISSVEALDFVDDPAAPEAYGFDKPVLKLAIRYAGGKPPTWFELGQKEGVSWARREGDGSVLRLDPAKAEDLVKAFREL